MTCSACHSSPVRTMAVGDVELCAECVSKVIKTHLEGKGIRYRSRIDTHQPFHPLDLIEVDPSSLVA